MSDVLVLLRDRGAPGDLESTLRSLRGHTPNLEIHVGDASAEVAADGVSAGGASVLVLASRSQSGAAPDPLARDAISGSDAADVVLLEVGTEVGPGWLDGLRAAAYADPVIATASAVPDGLLDLNRKRPAQRRPDDGAQAQGPALAEPLWGCVYVRRDALQTAANAQSATRRPIESLVLAPGLVHVLAPSVLASRPSGIPARPAASHTPAVARALAAIETSVEPLRVTVDLRCCASPLSGTQVHALNLVAALARREDLQVSVLAPSRLEQSVRPHFEMLPPAVQRYTAGQPIVPRPQVFHRPYQVLHDEEMRDVVTTGTRLVLTHQDMILDRTPSYFRSADEWHRYAATTALSFLAADEVVFFSEHARGDALRDGLVDASKTSVIPPGTNHLDGGGDATIPGALGALPQRPFLLMMGNAYAHKNRVFALRIAESLTRNGWDGGLVFAGETPGRGASVDEERTFLSDHGELRKKFVDLGAVTEAERRWLYANATLLLCPTLHEGFGLVPFEAAAAGTASVYSARTSLAEYLPPGGALLDLRSVDETTRRISAAVEDGHQLEGIVREIREAGEALTWARAADAYCDVYRRSLSRPVGLSLLSGHGLLAGALAQSPAGETERRLLVLFRRSAAVRLMVEVAFAVAFRLRRLTSRR